MFLVTIPIPHTPVYVFTEHDPREDDCPHPVTDGVVLFGDPAGPDPHESVRPLTWLCRDSARPDVYHVGIGRDEATRRGYVVVTSSTFCHRLTRWRDRHTVGLK